jgi:hypothetical protein
MSPTTPRKRDDLLSQACRKHWSMTTPLNNAFQAALVPFQPSVLTVLGAYLGVMSRASSLKTE